jgi:hypothetical protein
VKERKLLLSSVREVIAEVIKVLLKLACTLLALVSLRTSKVHKINSYCLVV